MSTERSAPIRGMVAAEGHCRLDAAAYAMLRHIGSRCARVTVTGVAAPLHPMASWAPLAGVPIEDLERMAIDEACLAAWRTVSLFPPYVPVEHRAASCWRDVLSASSA